MANCNLDVGCDECGICYAEAHGQPEQCGRSAAPTDRAEMLARADELERQAQREVALSRNEWPHHRAQAQRYAAELAQEARDLRARASVSGEQ